MEKLLLFDIDGTLTKPMEKITPEMLDFLREIVSWGGVTIGVVGGSDVHKARYQLGDAYQELFTHCFHENGCVYYRDGVLVHEEKLEDFLGEETLNALVTFLLGSIHRVDVPFRTGTFIERRSCMLNVSPIGRSCTQKQREEFFEYDKTHKIREGMVAEIREAFPDLPVEIAIGGMISIDIFPVGLNKTHALEFIPRKEIQEIHFFGDRTEKGGNDYEIFNSPLVVGHCVSDPADTMNQVLQLLK